MSHIIPILGLVFVCGVSTVNSQQSLQREKNQYVVVPREVALPVIAFQPTCPLKFEKVVLLARIGGGVESSYQLRNQGTKPIRSFTIAYMNNNGTGGAWGWTANSGEMVKPGQIVPLSEDDRAEIIPITEELRGKLKLREPMKMITVYMVERVEFFDGSVYTDEPTSKALQTYFENTG